MPSAEDLMAGRIGHSEPIVDLTQAALAEAGGDADAILSIFHTHTMVYFVLIVDIVLQTDPAAQIDLTNVLSVNPPMAPASPGDLEFVIPRIDYYVVWELDGRFGVNQYAEGNR